MHLATVMWIVILIIISPLTLAFSPIVSLVNSQNPVVLTSLGVSIECNASLSDDDGYGNITNVQAWFFDSSESSIGSLDDGNNHYTNSSCTMFGGSGNTSNVTCIFYLNYYANSGSNWMCAIEASDGQTNMTSNQSGVTIAELKALTSEVLDFPQMGLGNTSIKKTIQITNKGNVAINVNVSSSGEYAMLCTIGTIPLTLLRYSSSPSVGFDSMTSITSSPVTISSFTIPQRTNEFTESKDILYWMLRFPTLGVGGLCSGGIMLDAI